MHAPDSLLMVEAVVELILDLSARHCRLKSPELPKLSKIKNPGDTLD